MEEKTREILMEFLEALAGLTAKILELEENQQKIGMYEEFTGKKIMETFKREAIKGDK